MFVQIIGKWSGCTMRGTEIVIQIGRGEFSGRPLGDVLRRGLFMAREPELGHGTGERGRRDRL
jgi:hypothetical protein